MAIPAETYLQERLEEQISWLSQASQSNKRAFLRLRLLQILLGTAITIFSPFSTRFSWGALAVSLAGGAVAVAGSLMALQRHQENWLRYRSLAQALKHEKYLYLTDTPPYDAADSAFQRLVSTCEALMAAESNQWIRDMSPAAPLPSAKSEGGGPGSSLGSSPGRSQEQQASAPDRLQP
ncbi:MAG: DUF4231 domain-containing protein [Synechococcaceae cyanobacterium]